MDWTFLLTPLLVAPIVLLFRFLGCGLDTVGKGPVAQPTPTTDPAPSPPMDGGTTGQPPPVYLDNNPPDYRKFILGEQPNPGLVKNPGAVPTGSDVIAYWRLVDPPTSVEARDEKGFAVGANRAEYGSGYNLPNVNPTATVAGSRPKTPAQILTGQTGLIDSDPAALSRRFDGGRVRVPYQDGLYTEEFTLEAWIQTDPSTFEAGYEYVLFDAGGRYALPGSTLAPRGFRIFIDRTKGWQVQLAPGNTNLFTPSPLFPPSGARTHVAVTVARTAPGSAQRIVTVYVDGKPSPAVTVANYNPPFGTTTIKPALLIGVENSSTNPATEALVHPLLCRIQEVVLHRKAISQAEIENHVDINRKKN